MATEPTNFNPYPEPLSDPRQETMDFGGKTERVYPEGDHAEPGTKLEALSMKLSDAVNQVGSLTTQLCNKTDDILGPMPEDVTKEVAGAVPTPTQSTLYALENTAERLMNCIYELRSEVQRYTESGL